MFSTGAPGVAANGQVANGQAANGLAANGRAAARAETAGESVRESPAAPASLHAREGVGGGSARAQDMRRGVRLTGQRFFGGLFVLFVAIPLVYLGGFLAGRSALEEELMQASHMPKSVIEEPSRDKDAGAGEKDGKGQDLEDADDGILRPQDLLFARFLRAAPGEKVPEPRPFENLPPAVPRDASNGDASNGASNDASNGSSNGETAQPPMAPGMSPASAGGAPAQDTGLYDFVFQVAAFRRQEDAETTRIQLEAEGFRSRLEHNGSLYLVLLLSRGPLSRVDEIMETTARLRLGTPIERSRKAVPLPVGQRRPGP